MIEFLRGLVTGMIISMIIQHFKDQRKKWEREDNEQQTIETF